MATSRARAGHARTKRAGVASRALAALAVVATAASTLVASQVAAPEAAQAAQAAWWPWQDAMGGPCTARRWQAEGLMAPDGVHFTPAGYARAARQLADSLARLAG